MVVAVIAGACLIAVVPPVAAVTTVTDLGTLPGGTESMADAINPAGQMTGWSSTSTGDLHGAVWTPTGSGSSPTLRTAMPREGSGANYRRSHRRR